MYQKCPLCEGLAYLDPFYLGFGNNSTSARVICPTCKGSRVIHSETGLPPYSTFTPVSEEKAAPKEPKLPQLTFFGWVILVMIAWVCILVVIGLLSKN